MESSTLMGRLWRSFQSDARHFQIVFLAGFLLYGWFELHWKTDWLRYVVTLSTALSIQAVGLKLTGKPMSGLKSALITALGLCLLLRVGELWVAAFAAAVAIGSKFLIRFNGKHVFNPANLGVVVPVLLGLAWVSPGQWGNGPALVFLIGGAGLLVLIKATRLDTALAFLLVFGGSLALYQVVFLGWPLDYWLHGMSNGSLLLFSFFMITDPMTTPNSRWPRMAWAATLALVAFYLQARLFVQAAPILVLGGASLLVPILDRWWPSRAFTWKTTPEPAHFLRLPITIKQFPMAFRSMFLLLLLFVSSPVVQAFCGFYVAKADASIWNKASSVIIARKGNQTAVTMLSDFQGDVKDFAIVIPVPEVLKKDQIRVGDASVFQKFDDYSAPRLVEYYDENPCDLRRYEMYKDDVQMVDMAAPAMEMKSNTGGPKPTVTILERYTVGEYDILILSAEESQGLKIWLNENGYRVPDNAEEVLDPYLKSGMKFFVAKVNLENYAQTGFKELRPLQMTFNSPKFMLPIRLGMANAQGDQDLLIYALSDQGRIETTNYQTLEIPTDKEVPLFVKEKFGAFYGDLFKKSWKKNGENAVWLEYAWDISGRNYTHCDPCTTTPPTYAELREAGAFWITRANADGYRASDYDGEVFFTRLHVRYRRATFPQDLSFIATPNRAQFQGRYILTHPATGDLSCSEGKNYKKTLLDRRQAEISNLAMLTGWGATASNDYLYSAPLEGERNRHQPYIEPIQQPDSLDRGSIFIPQVNDPIDPPTFPLSVPTPKPWNRNLVIFLALTGLLVVGGLLTGANRGFFRPLENKS